MKHVRHLSLAVLLIGVLVLSRFESFTPQNVQSAPPPPRKAIESAWNLARDTGVYSFRTQVVQTTYPAPRLNNVGKPSTQERFAFEGRLNRPESLMEMSLGLSTSAAEQYNIRIEDGLAYGQTPDGAWEEIDNVGDVFAPGSDPLGFLSGAKNVRLVEDETHDLTASRITDHESRITDYALRFTHYAFDLDGHALAVYVRDQMQQHLQARGELPAGIDLETSDVYRKTEGAGELWLDSDGLPRRFTARLEFPSEDDGRRITAEFTTDFYDFERTALAKATAGPGEDFGAWIARTLNFPASAQGRQQLWLQAGLFSSTLALMALCISFWRTRTFYIAVATAAVAAMVLTPVLQAQHVAAFYERQNARTAESDARRERAELEEEVQSQVNPRDWNPHANPMEYGVESREYGENSARQSPDASSLTPYSLLPTSASSDDDFDTTDTDGDGLYDDDEDFWGTCASSADASCTDSTDSDGDGLLDGAEVSTLGTEPTLADHDGDTIIDSLEIQGFWYNGQQWYLNPLDYDTNGDSLIDGQECPELTMVEGGNSGSVCSDTDEDGEPDVFDFDNDGDGVPDAVDLSPSTAVGDGIDAFDYDNPFRLSVDGLTADEPVFVEIQLRPTDPQHLYYSGSVLDWPTYDYYGQIQRRKQTTFATTDNEDLQSSSDNANNGDIMLAPMLEVYIPYAEGYYGNLPVLDTITDTVDIDGWLDQDTLEAYGISAQQADDDGNLYLYVPLTANEDDLGNDRVAWSAQMLYWPTQSGWGNAHQFRLVWMVQMIVNEEYGADDTSTIAHIYTDDAWYITGLNVREDHGFELAIYAEDPAVDADATQEDQFWHLTNNLSLSFVEGLECFYTDEEDTSCETDDTRLTVAEIYERFNHSTNDAIADNLRWFVDDTIAVTTVNYEHQGYLTHVAMTDTTSFLDTYYGAYAATVPLLGFGREETYRSQNLDDVSPARNLTLDMTDEIILTLASLTAQAYRYDSGWESYDLDEYWFYLEAQLSDHPDFQPDNPNDEESVGEALGGIIMAQVYYAALTSGVTSLVEMNSVNVNASEYYNERALQPQTALAFKSIVTGWLYAVYMNWGVSTLPKAKATATGFKAFYKSTKTFLSNVYQFVNTAGGRINTEGSAYKLFTSVPLGGLSRSVIGVSVLAAFTLMLTALIVDTTANGFSLDTLFIIASGLTIAVTVVQLVSLVNKLYVAYRFFQTISLLFPGVSLFGMLVKVSQAARLGSGLVGLILGIAAVWGMIGYILGTNRMNKYQTRSVLAYGIAATIVTIVFFALLFIPVIGILLVLLITLFDAVVYLACAIAQSESVICKGITGLLTEFLADMIYRVDTPLQMTSADRLDYSISGPDLLDSDAGYSVDNRVRYSAVLTNTILDGHYNQDFHGKKRGRIAKYATFEYTLQITETDQHAGLSLGDQYYGWQHADIDADGKNNLYDTYSPDALDIDFNDVGAGINRQLSDVYLTEAYAIPIVRCWGPSCKTKTESGSSHIQIGEYLYYDVFPATLDEFYTLTEKNGSDGTSAYALAWGQDGDETFPRLKDADNDGLWNQADGGSDPDDSLWDTDGDGLSDYYEVSVGTDPEVADSDGDGLSDFEEERYGSDPWASDGDGDGLSDVLELEGWSISYRASDGGVETAWVWSDPTQSDGDSDGFDDDVEYIYGLNPNWADDADTVNNALSFESMEVRESAAPVMLLCFEESSGAQAFSDDSGFGNTASCENGSCPTAGVDGYYGSAAQFTEDYLSVDAVSAKVAGNAYSFGGWVYPTAGGAKHFFDFHTYDTGYYPVARLYWTGERFVFSNMDAPYAAGNSHSSHAWYHVLATIDADNNGVLYVNGIAEVTFTTALRPAAGDRVTLGQDWAVNGSSDNHFRGSLDDVVAFDYALTADQVLAWYEGRYDLNDLFVQPGADLYYRVVAKNTMLNRYARGYTFAQLEDETAPLTVDTAYKSFSLDPDSATVITGDVAVSPSASIGAYGVEVVAEGVITAPDESEFFVTMPAANTALYFEDNNFAGAGGDGFAAVVDDLSVACPYTSLYDQKTCPDRSMDGINGYGLTFDGGAEALRVAQSGSSGSLSDLAGNDFTLGAWIYPTHDAAESNRRAILGYHQPDKLWFRFAESEGSTTFYDEPGIYSASCSGDACPAVDGPQFDFLDFDGVDDLVTLPNNDYISTGAPDEYSVLLEFQIHRQTQEMWIPVDDLMVLYEQGGSTRGLSISANDHTYYGSKITVCAWDYGNRWHGCNTSGKRYSPGYDHQVVLTYQSNNAFKVYVNGDYVASISDNELDPDDDGIGIGGINSQTRVNDTLYSGGANFDGWIDELAFFNTVLTSDDVAYFYENGFASFPILYVQGDELGFAYHDGRMRNWTAYNTLHLDAWNHVALTFDASAESFVLYHNSSIVKQWSGHTPDFTFPGDPKVRLGWAGGGYGHFEGQMDSVVFYDQALSEDEVATLMASYMNENVQLLLELDEVPGVTEFQSGYAPDDIATCAGAEGGSCPLTGLRGIINWAAYFDGDDVIKANLAASEGDSIETEYLSVAAWVKEGQGVLFHYDDAHDVRLSTDQFAVYDGQWRTLSFSGATDTDDWTHIAATYDANDALRVYVNGAEVATTTLNGYYVALDSATSVHVGQRSNGSDGFTGYLDDVRLYDVALPAEQVSALYSQTPPQIKFTFDEAEGATTVQDSSPNAYVGAVEGVQPGAKGRLGNAVRFYDPDVFGNTANRISVADADALDDLQTNFTIVTWFKPDADAIVDNGRRSEVIAQWNGVRFEKGYDGQLRMSGTTLASMDYEYGTWNHIAIVVDTTTAYFYLNGELVETDEMEWYSAWDTDLSLGEMINRDDFGLVDTSLDEFAIYAHAFSAQEIADLYRLESRWYRRAATFDITVDSDAPAVALRSDLAYRLNQSTVLDVATRDATSSVARVLMGVKGPGDSDYAWQDAPACADAEPGVAWCPTFDPTQLAGEGRYDLQFRAVDSVGNSATSETYTLYVDDTPPDVDASYDDAWLPADEITDRTWTFALTGSVGDPALSDASASGSGVLTSSVQIALLDHTGAEAGRGYQTASVNGSAWAVDYVFGGVRPNGLYDVVVAAEDWAGNAVTATVGSVRIDVTPPDLAFYDWAVPDDVATGGGVITSGHALSGTVIDLAIPGSILLTLHLDETDGAGTYYDTTPEGNHAACAGATCPAETTGVFGQALHFDGNDDYLAISDPSVPVDDEAYTLAAWVKPDAMGDRGILGWGNYGADNEINALRLSSDGLVNAWENNDLSAATGSLTGGWRHVAATFDGATRKLYLDGDLVALDTPTGHNVTMNANFRIGSTDSGEYFDGALDEIIIADYALNDDQIYALAQSTVKGVSTVDLGFESLSEMSLHYADTLPADALLYLPFAEEAEDSDGNVTTEFADYAAGDVAQVITCDEASCPIVGASGIRDSALSFDGERGNAQHVVISGTTAINLSDHNQFSLGMWFWAEDINKDDDQYRYQMLLGQVPWYVALNNGELRASYAGGSTASTTAIASQRWHHVTMVISGTGHYKPDTFKLYLDGNLVDSVGGTMFYANDPNISLGADRSYSGFEGRLDEVAVFDRALTQNEIRTLMYRGDPQLWLGFDESELYNGDALAAANDLPVTATLVANDAGDKHASGQVGSGALTLDGDGDYVSIESSHLNVETSEAEAAFTQMVWVYPGGGNDYPIIGNTFYTDTAHAYPYLDVGNGGATLNFGFGNGTSLCNSNDNAIAMTANAWNHLAASFDGATYRIYVNGAPVVESVACAGETPVAAQRIDLGRNASHTFDSGQLDDVRIYPRALSALEIAEIYNESWQSATLADPGDPLSTWSQPAPEIEGAYHLSARAGDDAGNTSDIVPLWSGTLDAAAPRITFEAQQFGAGLTAQTTYTYTIDDVHLDADSVSAPCPEEAREIGYFNALWFRVLMGQTTPSSSQVNALSVNCTLNGHASSVDVTACDSYGNCATENFSPSTGSTPVVDAAILTPTHYATFTSTGNIEVAGAAYAQDELQAITVTVDGAQLHTQTWPAGATSDAWSTTWNPALDGLYTLDVTAMDRNGVVQAATRPIEVIISFNPPTVTFASTVLTRTHYNANNGKLALTGVTSAPAGLDNVVLTVVSLTQSSEVETVIEGDTWNAAWYLADGDVPDGRPYTVTATATDRGGRSTQQTKVITVDIKTPASVDVQLSHDGQPLASGDVVREIAPTLTFTWTTSSDDSGLAAYQVGWPELGAYSSTLTTTVHTHTPATFEDAYTAADGTRLTPYLATLDAYGNRRWQSYGDVYVDSPLTPDYIRLGSHEGSPYSGWMDSGCTLLGVDRRMFDATSDRDFLHAEQRFYTTWDDDALRFSWTGADWGDSSTGDLFVYLDTTAGGATTLYDPYASTVVITFPGNLDAVAISAPLNPRTDYRRDVLDAQTAFAADYALWAEDNATAHLLRWDGANWVISATLGSTQFQFDANRNDGQTDLLVPFLDLDIADPAAASLSVVAFATTDDALNIWATAPAANPVNDGRLIDNAHYAADADTFALINAYEWSSLGSALCPSDAGGDAQLDLALSTSPGGAVYSLLDDDLFWLWDILHATADAPGGAPYGRDYQVAHLRDLHLGIFDTSQDALVDGQTVTYILSYHNQGTVTATNVSLDLSGAFALSLPDGVYLSGEQRYSQTLVIGDVAPGASGSVTFNGEIDVAGAPSDYTDVAALDVAVTIDGGDPVERLWADHGVDAAAPVFADFTTPHYAVSLRPGSPTTTTFSGYAYDKNPWPGSGAPTLTLSFDVGPFFNQQVICANSAPDNGFWSCDVDLNALSGVGDLSDGDSITARVRATDGAGLTGDWSPNHTLTVDQVPPTTTVSADGENITANGQVVGIAGGYVVGGQASDDHAVDSVEVCVDGACSAAQPDVSALIYLYENTTSAAIGSCSGGELTREISVAHSFTVGEVSLGLTLDHPFRDDVQAVLAAPSGVTQTVLLGAQHQASDSADFDAWLDDANADPLFTYGDHVITTPAYDTHLRPYLPLNAFRGEGAFGLWELRLCDAVPDADSGAFERARLSFSPLEAGPTASTWSYNVSVQEGVEGVTQTVQVTAIDSAGNRATTPTTFTVGLDTSGPALDVSQMLIYWPTTLLTTTQTVFTGTVNDWTGFASLEVSILDPEGRVQNDTITVTDGAWSYDFLPNQEKDGLMRGRYQFWFEAADVMGNVTQPDAYTLDVDAPNVALDVTPASNVTLGSIVTYTLIFNNPDQTMITSAVITAPLPAAVLDAGIISGAAVINGDAVEWVLSDVPAASADVTVFTVTVSSNDVYYSSNIAATAYFSAATVAGQVTGSDSASFRTEAESLSFALDETATINSTWLGGKAVWGDYDNDGDLDYARPKLGGMFSILCENTGGDFIEAVNLGLENGERGGAWGDYDNDGDLDLLLTNNLNGDSAVFENTGGSFTALATVLPRGDGAWGDYDGDGDLDILIGARIFANTGGGFTEDTAVGLFGDGPVAWGDYDSDGDQDVFIGGRIFENTDDGNQRGNFDLAATLLTIDGGEAAWGDFDNDGDLDILLAGKRPTTYAPPIARVYRNDGDASATLGTSFTPYASLDALWGAGSAAWGDYDNDGDLDILLVGCGSWHCETGNVAKIYRNTGDGFRSSPAMEFPAMSYPRASWADYDNDGDLDIALFGCLDAENCNFDQGVNQFYRNERNTVNTRPDAPGNPSATMDGALVTLSWDAASDNETPADGLSYNLYAGSDAAKMNLIAPMAFTSGADEGLRLLPARGPFQTLSHTYIITQPGVYTWSVQAVDAGFAGSLWAAEGTFEVDPLPQLTMEKTVSDDWPDPGQTLTYTLSFANGGALTATDVIITDTFPVDQIVNPIYSSNVPITRVAGTTYTWQVADLAPGARGEISITGVVSATLPPGTSIDNTATITTPQEGYANDNVSSAEVTVPLFDLAWTASSDVYGDGDWGDYDNDGDLDVLLIGDGDRAQLYENTGSDLVTNTATTIVGGSYSAAAWGDYDADGDLDLAVMGHGLFGYIYENVNGSFVTDTVSSDALMNASHGNLDWGDFDNDGDLDLAQCGRPSGGSWDAHCNIYVNTDGRLMQHASFYGVFAWYWQVRWFDYDGDGDLDLAISGHSFYVETNWHETAFYENRDGDFVRDFKLPPTKGGRISFGDYDADGDLDILYGGQHVATRVYRNDGGGSFIVDADASANLMNLGYGGSADWGDYDNDGDLDILLTDADGAARLYQNTDGAFIEVSFANLSGTGYGSQTWADFDNDGDLDVLLKGKLYLSNMHVQSTNTPPSPPSAITATVETYDVNLAWNAGSDTETLTESLRYNLYVGSAAGQGDVLPPMAFTSGISEGARLLPAFGNAPEGLSATGDVEHRIVINQPGVYYWGVQAIDAGYAGSTWTTGSFNVAKYPGASLSKRVEREDGATPDEMIPGETFNYVLDFANTGNLTLTNVIITDIIPTEVTALAYYTTSAGSDFYITHTSDISYTFVPTTGVVIITPTGNLTFTWLIPELRLGQSGSLVITGQLTTTLNVGAVVTNTAALTMTEFDADLSDNEDTASFKIATNCFVSVDDSGATDYSSVDASALQEAVDAASPGDAIKIAGRCGGVQSRAGTQQTVYLSKTLTLRGGYTYTNWLAGSQPGVYTTTLDGLSNGRVVFITGTAAITLENLTVSGGQVKFDHGGGIYHHGESLYIVGSTVSGNQVLGADFTRPAHGGGIWSNSILTLSHSTVSDNAAARYSYHNVSIGGGVYNEGGTVWVEYSTISGNTAERSGGGILNGEYGIVTVTHSVFDGNHASSGGGILTDHYSRLYVSDSTFSNNVVSGGASTGGAIATGYEHRIVLRNSIFTGNSAGGNGGAISNAGTPSDWLAGVWTLIMDNCTLTGNAANWNGGGLYNGYGNLLITGSTFISNTAQIAGGGLLNFNNIEGEIDFG